MPSAIFFQTSGTKSLSYILFLEHLTLPVGWCPSLIVQPDIKRQYYQDFDTLLKNSSLPDSQLTSLPNASKQVTDSPHAASYSNRVDHIQTFVVR